MKYLLNIVLTAVMMLSVPGVTFINSTYAATAVNLSREDGEIVDRASFDHYISLFNSKNPACFEKYYSANVRMQNGKLVLNGIPEVKDHYARIWPIMQEEVRFNNFSFDGKTLAVDMHTHFTVINDAEDSPFGSVKKGENFDFYGVVMYRVNEQGKFYDIKVAYLDFTRTTDGRTISLGLPH
ncbi:hypothetical protein [Brenneria tiliae]|uniref:Nuclear transport factor 2 family protein n=1 Tax=Brenneria tiliae TaxID=2914984 RepID=A0ABT0MXR5_9GAMM|nr:hypothetical protein [Brenneria tiliae]MCL2894392.1 hypothetical protein [Brenneria tiliae]